MQLSLPLSDGQASRIRSHALADFKRRASASVDEVARSAARSVLGVSVTGIPERMDGESQRRFFSVYTVVAAARVEYLDSEGFREDVDELRELVVSL